MGAGNFLVGNHVASVRGGAMSKRGGAMVKLAAGRESNDAPAPTMTSNPLPRSKSNAKP